MNKPTYAQYTQDELLAELADDIPLSPTDTLAYQNELMRAVAEKIMLDAYWRLGIH